MQVSMQSVITMSEMNNYLFNIFMHKLDEVALYINPKL